MENLREKSLPFVGTSLMLMASLAEDSLRVLKEEVKEPQRRREKNEFPSRKEKEIERFKLICVCVSIEAFPRDFFRRFRLVLTSLIVNVCDII